MIGRVENTCAVSSTGSTLLSTFDTSSSLEWILDTAAITHTCADRSLMTQLPHYVETNTPHESWTGEVTTEHLVSQLPVSFLSAQDRRGETGEALDCVLTGVRNVVGCHVNLLSVNALEEQGWQCESQYPQDGPPRRLLWKGPTAIVFVKSRGYYRTRGLCNSPQVVASFVAGGESIFRNSIVIGWLQA
ncbi:uncharacterized protein PITG_16143 [Phytophthora infestans T30-4]|uniref:Uncharacterized protein n=1 Tax=Phytophthora infestans (strain T30-4) TaxID=403677 RepID=D0NSZ8_PHYIT|nr:uncharacterized protein PITG_16143 [Phytophthora infestans T30-4]EEY64710.1 conserved hypothetical protein [Phytophthora infestans T30-4]|eukprot:XP_002897910.1 conserved hypothetical protein [Phytophthora infestans T30-4]